MAAAFKPFADDETAMTIGGFTAENGAACVSLSGSLDLTRDKQGLAHARSLLSLLQDVVQVLEHGELPDRVAEPQAKISMKDNPFG